MKYIRMLFTASGQKAVYGNQSQDEDPDFDSSNDPMMIVSHLFPSATFYDFLYCVSWQQFHR